jgi:uncharacterized phage-associated protein
MKIQEQKRINAILFFAMKAPENKISRLRLMKLLWLADRIHLNRYGRFILRDTYYALPHGPVPSKTMDLSERSVEDIFTVRGYEIEAEDNFNPKFFSKSDLEVLNEVWERFGDLKELVLRDYSHFFPEWKRFERELTDETLSNSYPMVIEDFFKEPTDVDNFKLDTERSELSKSIFKVHNKIQEILTR